MPKRENFCLRGLLLTSCILFWVHTPGATAQSKPEVAFYSRVNTFAVFGAYSNDSSHIVIGQAEQRKLMQFGVAYSRRLILDNLLNWQYDAEFMPVAVEGDPLTRFVTTQTSPTNGTYTGTLSTSMVKCAPTTITYNTLLNGITYSGSEVFTCYGRRWTMGEAISLFGLQLNFAPRHKLQPLLIGHGGYMYSTQAVPVIGAGSFNFTFDGGIGVEFYLSNTKSIRADYRYHHISNNNTANENPGVDNGLLQVTYSFGR